MSEHRDDPELTAWALGEPVDAPHDEQALGERARVEQAGAFLRDVLRSDDVPALDAAQRVEIMHRAEARRKPRSLPWLLAACLAMLVTMLGVYLAVVLPAQQRALVAERARVAAELAAREAEREAEVRAREAEVQAARMATEKAASASAERAMLAPSGGAAAASARARPSVADVDQAKPPHAASRPGRPSASKAGAGSSAGAGGCDPNDPLCGL